MRAIEVAVSANTVKWYWRPRVGGIGNGKHVAWLCFIVTIGWDFK